MKIEVITDETVFGFKCGNLYRFIHGDHGKRYTHYTTYDVNTVDIREALLINDIIFIIAAVKHMKKEIAVKILHKGQIKIIFGLESYSNKSCFEEII